MHVYISLCHLWPLITSNKCQDYKLLICLLQIALDCTTSIEIHSTKVTSFSVVCPHLQVPFPGIFLFDTCHWCFT